MTNYLFISLQTQQNDKSEQGKISCLYWSKYNTYILK
jgi:hypothetical protein